MTHYFTPPLPPNRACGSPAPNTAFPSALFSLSETQLFHFSLFHSRKGSTPTLVRILHDHTAPKACRGGPWRVQIDPLFLPPYSSNLNLIERLWKLTKQRCLTNRYYPAFGAFCGAIDKCLEDLSGPFKKELTSLMTLNFQFFKNHNS